MFRLIGFLFGVVITVVALAVAVDAPTRERAAALSTDLTAAIFNAVEWLKTQYDVGGDGADAEPAAFQRTTRTVSVDSAPMEKAPKRHLLQRQNPSPSPHRRPSGKETRFPMHALRRPMQLPLPSRT
jgi:hypothetical protein